VPTRPCPSSTWLLVPHAAPARTAALPTCSTSLTCAFNNQYFVPGTMYMVRTIVFSQVDVFVRVETATKSEKSTIKLIANQSHYKCTMNVQ
jgi:hypothetical protein